MPRKIGIVASQAITGVVAPTFSIGAATNYNQNIATFNATALMWGDGSTSVVFQYSTASNFSSFSSATAVGSPFTANTATMYVNVSGLTENTTYYVRAVATNTAGSTTTASVSFATWHVVTDIRTPTPSGYGYATTSGSMTLPTVTPTNGTEVDPALLGYGLMGSGAYHGGAPSGRSGAGAAGWRGFAWSWYNMTPSGYAPGYRTFTYTLGGSALWDYANRPLPYSVASAGTDSTMTFPGGSVIIAGGGKLFEALGYPGGDTGSSYKEVSYLATPSNPANQYNNYSNSSHGYVYRRWSTPRWDPIPGFSLPQTSTDVDTMTAIGGAGGAGSTTHSNVDGSHPGGVGLGLGVGGIVGGAGSSASTTGGVWNRNSPMPAYSDYGSGLLQFNEADGAISSAGYAGGSRSNVRSVVVFQYYGP